MSLPIKPVTSAFRLALYLKSPAKLKAEVLLATNNYGSDIDKAHAWVRFLRERVRRACVPPTDSRGQMITHPIFLLQHQWMLCGQVARLVLDGLATLGVPARVLHFNGHVTAEYFVEQRWIFAEADLFNHGQEVIDQQGNLLGLDSPEFFSRLEASIKPYTRPTCHQLRGIRVGDWGSLSTAELRNFWREIFRPVRYEVSGGVLDHPLHPHQKRLTTVVGPVTLLWMGGRRFEAPVSHER